MEKSSTGLNKQKAIDFGVLTLRWYLIFYMLSYGWAKVTLSQFGMHDPTILDQALKDVDSFYVAWHLYGRSNFFNIFTGFLEIIGAILLIFNRTTLIGALLVLTILGNILVIDIAFTTGIMGYALPLRILGMMIAAGLILYYYKDKMIAVWKTLTENVRPKFKYQWWIFLILPVLGFVLDFVFAMVLMPLKMLLDWIGT